MEKKINRGVTRTGETDIKVHLIDSFPNHPYHVFDDEEMTELAASIEANGLLNPIIVRSKADGRYELISGHRRKRAYEILKINKIRAIIVDITDDEAIIMMVDSNCQRSKILPSEKAFSYKMKLDAIKRQGKRNDLTSTQVVSKLRSNEELGKEVNESRETIRRFIRLTNLIPELLDFVDKGRMKMQPAVELSYLDEESQRDLVDIIDGTEVFPSFSQTVRMRKAFKDGELTYELVERIMAEDKANQKPKYRFSVERLGKYMPTDLNDKQAEEYVLKALSYAKQSSYKSFCASCGQRNYKTVEETGNCKCGRCGKESRVNYQVPPMEYGTYPGRETDMGEDFEDWDIYSLRERVKLVQGFDRFCDDVLSEVKNILDNFEVDEDIVYVPQTVKRLREAS